MRNKLERLLKLDIYVTARPDAPSHLKVDDVDEHAITLSWEKPKNDGGKRIEGYVVEYKEPEGTRWKTANDIPVQGTNFSGRKDSLVFSYSRHI